MEIEKKIFIVNGKPRAGKDTFAKILQSMTSSVHKYSSVTKVKRVALECGWSGGKSEKDRKFLSDLKLLTTEYSDMAFKDLEKEVCAFLKGSFGTSKIMLIDIREPEEIERACEAFGAKSIFIKNDRVENITSNVADAYVENYEYDIVIENNGTFEEFANNIEKFLEQLVEGEC